MAGINVSQVQAALADLGVNATGLTEVHILGASNLLGLGTTVTTVISGMVGAQATTTTTVWNVTLL